MIRNYPGFPHGVSGGELTRRACEQAWMFGAHMVFSQPAVGLECHGDQHVVHLTGGGQLTARAVIVAPGIAWRRLGVPRLEALVGSGVFYGAAGSETRAMEGRDVFVVGAGNSAGQTALHLARHARQVTMLVRGDSLARSMSEYLTREIEVTATSPCACTPRSPTATVSSSSRPSPCATRRQRPDRAAPRGRAVRADRRGAAHAVAARGDPARVGLHQDRARRGARTEAVAAGRAPLPLETSMPGVFAAGDARYRSIKRVASAVGDGATVVRLAQEYIAGDHADELTPAVLA